jgi:hypothetical protein
MTGSLPGEPQSGAADLVGYGRLTWPQLLDVLGGASAAWADYAGFHIRPAPPEPPPYTHIWAWTSRWLIRARIDGDTAITGALALTGEPAAALEAVLREPVTYQRVQAGTWPASDKRIGPLDTTIADRPVTLYLIAGPAPVTFISLSQIPKPG